ncbi:MAG: type IV pilus assembly protein PilM [Thermodesulfobacteriota bacterium]|nr:type IV pilus assembly protein PilM [Thermodesulfobacteriota bacterium]
MAFKKKDHLFGVDIGSRTIKLAEVLEKKGERSLSKLAMANLPVGSIVEGRIRQAKVVADTIKGLVKREKIKTDNVATSISGYSVIIERIVVGSMSDEELHDRIQYEAEQYIPFDVEDVNIDFEILGEHETNPNQMNVMLVAAKKEVINEYIEVLEMADLNPCVIDVDVFALERVFEEGYLEEEKSVALVDIGANKLNVNIVKDSVSAFTRDVAVGGEEITREIADKLQCSFEEAEEIKLAHGAGKMSQEDYEKIVTSFISKWGREIRRVIDFYYSTASGEEIKQILLSGGATQTPGFFEHLAAETSVAVAALDPFKALDVKNKSHDMNHLKRMAPQAAICMGLATRRVGDK